MDDWLPLGRTAADNEVLVDGIPPWMAADLYSWITSTTKRLAGNQLSSTVVKAFDRRMRSAFPLYSEFVGVAGVLERRDDVDLTMAYVDYLVARCGTTPAFEKDIQELETLLAESGSAYAVGPRGPYRGIVERVPEGVTRSVNMAIDSTGSAGQLLAEAWYAAFGRSPDPEESYEKAIKSVEEAGVPVVTPNDSKATLGKMIRVMQDQGDWALEPVDAKDARDFGLLVAMCKTLWEGQPSRHGANGYRKPTQGEAEAAVFLAVPLVQWFSSGQIQRRPPV